MDTRAPALAAALLFALVGCGSGDSKSADGDPTETPGAATGTAISIREFAYRPSPLTVAPGATVTVTNFDSSPHTVTSEKSGAFTANDVKQGTPVTFTAPSEPGTYRYICGFHASMHGTLIVKSN